MRNARTINKNASYRILHNQKLRFAPVLSSRTRSCDEGDESVITFTSVVLVTLLALGPIENLSQQGRYTVIGYIQLLKRIRPLCWQSTRIEDQVSYHIAAWTIVCQAFNYFEVIWYWTQGFWYQRCWAWCSTAKWKLVCKSMMQHRLQIKNWRTFGKAWWLCVLLSVCLLRNCVVSVEEYTYLERGDNRSLCPSALSGCCYACCQSSQPFVVRTSVDQWESSGQNLPFYI